MFVQETFEMLRFVSSRRKLSDAVKPEVCSKTSQSPGKRRERSRLLSDWRTSITTLYVICSFAMLIVMFRGQSVHNDIAVNITSFSNASRSLTYAIFGKNVDSGYLRHVIAVFQRLGYERVDVNDDWDVLWAHEYPFRTMYSTLKKLKPHQKVNHFPGSGYITNKLELSTSEFPNTLRAFKIPQDKEKLLDYARRNINATFVQKDNNHRGITIKHLNDIDLNANGTFVQEFMSKPYLIDGYKFDVGVYTILTSINPLRVYIYYGDVLFRFCPVKYHPFDPKILDKYVVGDDYLPIWKVPSLKILYSERGFSMKDTFDTFLKNQGIDPSIVWNQINEIIQNIYLLKESNLQQSSVHYTSSTNFFEMVRIDFVIDEDLNVYLMEANMSPNLSSAHYPPNQLLYEQVLYNTLALVGVGQRVKSNTLQMRSTAEEEMMVALKNILVFPQLCSNAHCLSCETTVCNLCKQCLTKQLINHLKLSYNEHVNRLDCRRAYPPSLDSPLPHATSYMGGQSLQNQLLGKWFLGKCQLDRSWCT